MNWDLLFNLLGLLLPLFIRDRRNNGNTCNSCSGSEPGKRQDIETASRCEIESVSASDIPSKNLERSTTRKTGSIGFVPGFVITALWILAVGAALDAEPETSNNSQRIALEEFNSYSLEPSAQQKNEFDRRSAESFAQIAGLERVTLKGTESSDQTQVSQLKLCETELSDEVYFLSEQACESLNRRLEIQRIFEIKEKKSHDWPSYDW